MIKAPYLFDDNEIPETPLGKERNFKSIEFPLWSEEKAKLIQEYLRLFTFITKHGTYIDGFAAPQRRNSPELCSAALALANEPKWIRNFVLCDLDPKGASLLRSIAMQNEAANRKINILCGDFNVLVEDALTAGNIKKRTAAFALLDQRTFECSWDTVKKIAAFKSALDSSTTKVEIFYFLASGWLDRSFAGVKLPTTASKLDAWWGRTDWRKLQGMQGIPRAKLVAERFKSELGYISTLPYAIHNRRRQGRTMYHMIHATDHEEAPFLMLRAYRKVSGRSDIGDHYVQTDMDSLWSEVL